MSRVKMPHNNRMSSSVALKTNDMWSKTIGFDPYGPGKAEETPASSDQTTNLLLLARMSNLSGAENRGGCKKCGMLGHLTFQCRNTIMLSSSSAQDDSSSDDSSDDDDDRKPSEKTTRDKVTAETTTSSSSEKKRRRHDEVDDSDGSRKDLDRSKKHSKSHKSEKRSKHKHKHKHDKKEKKSKHKKEKSSSSD